MLSVVAQVAKTRRKISNTSGETVDHNDEVEMGDYGST